MNYRRLLLVEIRNALEDLVAPFLDDLELGLAHLLEILSQTAAGNDLGDEMNLFFFLANPGADERDDVWMIELLYDFDFGLDSRPFCLGKSRQTDNAPRNFTASIVVDAPVDRFVRSSAQFLIKSFESPAG